MSSNPFWRRSNSGMNRYNKDTRRSEGNTFHERGYDSSQRKYNLSRRRDSSDFRSYELSERERNPRRRERRDDRLLRRDSESPKRGFEPPRLRYESPRRTFEAPRRSLRSPRCGSESPRGGSRRSTSQTPHILFDSPIQRYDSNDRRFETDDRRQSSPTKLYEPHIPVYQSYVYRNQEHSNVPCGAQTVNWNNAQNERSDTKQGPKEHSISFNPSRSEKPFKSSLIDSSKQFQALPTKVEPGSYYRGSQVLKPTGSGGPPGRELSVAGTRGYTDYVEERFSLKEAKKELGENSSNIEISDFGVLSDDNIAVLIQSNNFKPQVSEKTNKYQGLSSRTKKLLFARGPKRMLSGARFKWYQRYRSAGLSAPEALELALEGSKTNRSEKNTSFFEKSQALADCNTIRIAILPTEFPQAHLSIKDLMLAENMLVEEMSSWSEHKLQFSGITFASGMMIVNCETQQSAEWLRRTVPQMTKLEGVKLATCEEEDIPKRYTATFLLPRSEEMTKEKLLRIITSQNEGLEISQWNILDLSSKKNGQELTVGIDEKSCEVLKNNGYSIHFGFGKCPCEITPQ